MFLFCLRPWHSLVLPTVLPSASLPFCVCFSVVIGSPYRIALGTPGGGEQSDQKRLSFSGFVRIRG